MYGTQVRYSSLRHAFNQQGALPQRAPATSPNPNAPSWRASLKSWVSFFTGSAQQNHPLPPPSAAVSPSNSLEEAFLCPITLRIMVDPVIVNETGHTFERASIEKWLRRSLTNPMTNDRLSNPELIPNRALANAIEAYILSRYTSVLRIAPNSPLPQIRDEKHIIIQQTNTQLTAYWLNNNQRVTWTSLPLLPLSQQVKDKIPEVGHFSNDRCLIHHIVSEFGCLLEKPHPLSETERKNRITEEANLLVNHIDSTIRRLSSPQNFNNNAAKSYAATTFTHIRKTQLGLLNNPDICGIPLNIAQEVLKFVLANPILLSAHELPQFCKEIEVRLNREANQDNHDTPEITSPTPTPNR